MMMKNINLWAHGLRRLITNLRKKAVRNITITARGSRENMAKNFARGSLAWYSTCVRERTFQSSASTLTVIVNILEI